MKKITRMTSTNQSDKTNKRNIAILIIFLVVLCILGLSMIRPSYACGNCGNHSCVTMKDVTVSFTGNDAASASATLITLSNGWTYGPVGTNEFVIPVGYDYAVSYTAAADYNNWGTPQSLETGLAFYSGDGSVYCTPVISVSYSMSVTP